MTLTIATSLEEVLSGLAQGARPIAGGTDLVVGARQGKGAMPETLIAIDRLPELASIEVGSTHTAIGAGVTHAQLMTNSTILDNFTAIADAAALVGSPATRNVGTLGGNVMNGSPAMDTGAPLVVLDAVAELASTTGTRTVELADLWTGPGTTSARPDELCTALTLPNTDDRTASAYVRLEYRRAMEIAIVGAAAYVELGDDDVINTVRVALTAVAPVIVAVEGLDEVQGQPLESVAEAVASTASEQASPISDLRASDRYRRHTIGVMASRAVDAAARRAGGESIAVPVNRALGIGEA